MMGIATGALLSYKPAKQESINTSFQIDSDISEIDDRSVILNFYSDLKKQYIDITLPYDIYNFLQTYLPDKKYGIVEEIEKKTAICQSTDLIEKSNTSSINEPKSVGEKSYELNEQMLDFKQKIDKLLMMRDAGILSQEEFGEQKKRILDNL